MVLLRGLAQDKPAELLVTSLVRANFCGSLASLTGLSDKASELFLMGLFSLLDVMVSRPMDEIMKDMPLARDVKTALVGGRNQYGGILELVVSYEKGDLESFLVHTLEFVLDEGLITDLYLQSIDLAEEAMQLYGTRGIAGRQQP
jgi:c-di-GMP-related signal transduction protein